MGRFGGPLYLTKEFNNDNLLIIDIIMKDRRNTMQRELTYNAVLSYPGHPSAEDIYRVISSRYSTISKATVYRNLNMLADDGKIGKVPSMLGYEAHYDHRTDHHSHAICIKCGKVVDVDVQYDRALVDMAESMEEGFTLFSHDLIFEGICKECRNKESSYGTEGIKD